MNKKAFTLVELAIVITIIGLLIGGVLKGQELLENARMTSAATQLKSYNAAVTTFKDIYKAWPGDIANPSNFLQNCTTSPCNISGNADGMIGADAGWGSDESNNFWLHLAKAGLVSGVDPNATWVSGTWFPLTGPQPNFPLGGRMTMIGFFNVNVFVVRDGSRGYYWHSYLTNGTASQSIPRNVVGKFDLKVDDGKPKTGSNILYGSDTLVGDNYDPNDKTLSYMLVKTDF